MAKSSLKVFGVIAFFMGIIALTVATYNLVFVNISRAEGTILEPIYFLVIGTTSYAGLLGLFLGRAFIEIDDRLKAQAPRATN